MTGDATSPTSVDVERALRDLIRQQHLADGDRLGSERALTDQLGTTRTALRNALSQLEHEGLVRRVMGRSGGVFVRSGKVVRDLTDLLGVPEFLQRQGYVAGGKVLSAHLRAPDDEIAHKLGIGPDELIYDLVRVRLADGEPISLEHAYVLADIAPGLLEKGIGGSITQILRHDHGVVTAEATESIELRMADAQEASLLGVPVDSPLLSVERTAVTPAGRIFEYSVDLFRADKIRIVVRASWGEGDDPVNGTERQIP